MCALKNINVGPVGGQVTALCAAHLPPTPSVALFWHTFLPQSMLHRMINACKPCPLWIVILPGKGHGGFAVIHGHQAGGGGRRVGGNILRILISRKMPPVGGAAGRQNIRGVLHRSRRARKCGNGDRVNADQHSEYDRSTIICNHPWLCMQKRAGLWLHR